MRVALIGPVPPSLGGATPGGVATHQVYLAEGLAAAGVDAPLLATNTVASAEQRPTFSMFRVGRTWTGVQALPRYAFKLASERRIGSRKEVLRNLLWYRRFLNDVRPDVIHVQHPLERCEYVRLVQHFEGWHVPVVVTAHSLFGEHERETIETLMAPNLRAAKRVIAVSEHIAEQAVQLGVNRRRIHVVRSGVDIDRYQPRDRASARQRLGLGQQTDVLLFVGNLEPRKQVDVLLRAMAEIPEARLLVVGSGENAGALDQTDVLHKLARELRIEERVRFLGRIDERELMDCYAAADLFALPSSSEAQGIVALEAMACGLPVVATAVGGLLGTIEQGTTGFLVPSGEVAPLAECIRQLLAGPDQRTRIGSAARNAVERNFSWRAAVEATVGVYGEAMCSSA